MPTPPTFDALYDAGRTEVESRDPRLTDWTEGSALDALNGAGALLADEVIRITLAAFGEQFVDVAEGDALDALALDRFNLTRNAASGAVGYVRFTRGSVTGVVTIPAGTTVRGEVDGATVSVTVDTDTDMPAADSYVDVRCTCTTTGRDGNVDEGVLDELVDSIPDDPTIDTVTNPERFAGGDVAESDVEFRDRIRRFLPSLRRATVSALEAAALSVPGVQFATVDESFVAPEDGGYVAIYVGDPDGSGNTALAEDVAVEIENWRAAGVAVQVLAASREEIDVALSVVHAAGVDATELAAAIRARVEAVVDALPPGRTLHLSALVAAAHQASTDVRSVTVSEPTADRDPVAVQNAIRIATLAVELTEG